MLKSEIVLSLYYDQHFFPKMIQDHDTTITYIKTDIIEMLFVTTFKEMYHE